jgi:hypothetical protein
VGPRPDRGMPTETVDVEAAFPAGIRRGGGRVRVGILPACRTVQELRPSSAPPRHPRIRSPPRSSWQAFRDSSSENECLSGLALRR